MSVFANGMEISSKSMGGKSICQFPDVCFTPPQTPATPPGVPIPYPNTGMASDTTDGSSSVKIGGSEVMLKDRSAFKKSTGDEAGAAPKKGMVNSKNSGKAYFIAWSMDVKVEGENVVRNLDMTTHNHGSGANGPAPMVHTATSALGKIDACKKEKEKVEEKCGDEDVDPCPGSLAESVTDQRAHFKRGGDESRTKRAGAKATKEAQADACVKAMRCHLRPYSPMKEKGGCCPGQSPHHIPPKSMMAAIGGGYSESTALCICMEGASQHVGSHGEAHAALDHIASKPGALDAKGQCTLSEYNKACADATQAQTGCSADCIEAQLNGSFSDAQKKKKVTHWQSNSKQLSQRTKNKLDKMYKAAKKVGES